MTSGAFELRVMWGQIMFEQSWEPLCSQEFYHKGSNQLGCMFHWIWAHDAPIQKVAKFQGSQERVSSKLASSFDLSAHCHAPNELRPHLWIASIWKCICIHTYKYIYICIYLYMYIYICICMYIYLYHTSYIHDVVRRMISDFFRPIGKCIVILEKFWFKTRPRNEKLSSGRRINVLYQKM